MRSRLGLATSRQSPPAPTARSSEQVSAPEPAPASSTRNSRAWVPSGISPISSRKMVPPFTVSKYPFLESTAPVKDPFS